MNFDTIKKHPAAAVGVLALGLLILYLLVGSGGGASAATSTGPSEGLQVAELNAATGLAQSQLAAQSNDKQIEAATNIASLSANAALLGKYSDNDTARAIAGLDATTKNRGIDASVALGTKQIDATTAQTLAQFKQAVDIAAITSAVNVEGIRANRDTGIASITALSDANKYTAQLGAQTSQLISNNQASVAKNKSNNDFFGNILGIGASLLGFL